MATTSSVLGWDNAYDDQKDGYDNIGETRGQERLYRMGRNNKKINDNDDDNENSDESMTDRQLNVVFQRLQDNIARRKQSRRWFLKLIYHYQVFRLRLAFRGLRLWAYRKKVNYLQLLVLVGKLKDLKSARNRKLLHKGLRKWYRILPKNKQAAADLFYRHRLLSSCFGELVRLYSENKAIEASSLTTALTYQQCTSKRSAFRALLGKVRWEQWQDTQIHYHNSKRKRKKLKKALKMWRLYLSWHRNLVNIVDVCEQTVINNCEPFDRRWTFYCLKKWKRSHGLKSNCWRKLIQGRSFSIHSVLQQLRAHAASRKDLNKLVNVCKKHFERHLLHRSLGAVAAVSLAVLF
jgi:hypothetical protein